MTDRATIYINGKFLAQRITGVQRFATEVTQALDRLATLHPDAPRFVLLVPRSARGLTLNAIEQRTVGMWPSSLHLWEHVALPVAARSGTLLSLAGSAPFSHRRQVASLLDTAVYDHPEAYTASFVTLYRMLFAHLARTALLVITLTDFTRYRLQNRLSPRGRIVPIGAAADHFRYLTTDTAALQRFGLEAGSYYLAVGSDNPTKNFTRLVEAFEAMPPGRMSRRLVIVGGANPRVFSGGTDQIEDERILRIGAVSDATLKTLYQHAHAFLFPSIYEGFGLPPLEAMICGCPVIAARAASIPEVCGDAALYFDPFDVAAIGQAMRQIDEDDVLRAQLIEAGSARCRNFSWDKSAALLFRALNDVVTRLNSTDDGTVA